MALFDRWDMLLANGYSLNQLFKECALEAQKYHKNGNKTEVSLLLWRLMGFSVGCCEGDLKNLFLSTPPNKFLSELLVYFNVPYKTFDEAFAKIKSHIQSNYLQKFVTGAAVLFRQVDNKNCLMGKHEAVIHGVNSDHSYKLKYLVNGNDCFEDNVNICSLELKNAVL